METPGELRNIDCDVLNLLVEEVQELQHLQESSKDDPEFVWQESSWPNIRVQYKLDHEDVQTGEFQRNKPIRFSEVLRGTYELRNLTSLLGLLHSTTKALLDKIEPTVQSSGSSLGRLLQNLPDELLMKTLKLACEYGPVIYPLEYVHRMLVLSHVNRRFRSVAIRAVDVWATVSTSTPLELTDSCLTWSKCAALNVDITPYHTVPIEGYLDKVLPLASRWKELSFTWSDYDVHSEILKESCTGLHLPNLEHLEYTLNTPREDSSDHIYLSWKAPKLRSIAFAGVAPKVFPNSSIVSVRIRCHHEKADKYIPSLHAYQSFLRDSPTVENLKISCDIRPVNQWASASFPRLCLENIRSVEILCEYQFWNVPERQALEEHPFCLFVQSLHLPNLERLSILVELHTSRYFKGDNAIDMDISDLVFAFTPSPQTHSPVKHLELCVQGSRDTHRFKNLLTIPLERFPALRNLSVHIEGFLKLDETSVSCEGDDASDVFPALECLELRKCWEGALDFLRGVFEKTKKSKSKRHNHARGSNTKVWVKRCPFVREEELLEFVTKKDLVFEEATMTDRLDTLLKSCGILPGHVSSGS